MTDRYGDGDVVAGLEVEVAALLGQPTVRDLPGVTVVPDPPQTPMLHPLLRTGAEDFRAAARALAEDGLWSWERSMTTGDPAVRRVELAVGDATMALTRAGDPERDRDARRLMTGARVQVSGAAAYH